MYIHKNNNINENMTEQEQIFFEQRQLWSQPTNKYAEIFLLFLNVDICRQLIWSLSYLSSDAIYINHTY